MDTSITVELAEGTDKDFAYEFSINGTDYQDSPEFAGLTADSDYSVTVRVKGGTYDGQDYNAGEPSEALMVHTLKSALPAPAMPDVAKRTDTQITFSGDTAGMEFGLVNGSQVLWQSDAVFKSLIPGTQYSFVFRMSYDPEKQMPSTVTDVLTVNTLKSGAEAPAAPVLKDRTENSLTVETAEHQEYAIYKNGVLSPWQTGGEFTGLNPKTQYLVVTRMSYDPNEAMESHQSTPLEVKTLVAFADSSVKGITANGVYDAGSTFTIQVTGSGMDNTAPVPGDSRWKPVGWSWGSGAKGSWDSTDYSMAFGVKEAGKYTLTITFGLETYTSAGWESAGKEQTLTTSFTVVAKEFTLKATAAKGGTITPSGTLKTVQAQDYTFTMTPDKDYKIAHVYIDGKEVKVNGNKYTFEKINGDHSIYVVFERDGALDAPKTGDDMVLWLWWTVAGVSLIVVIGAAAACIYRRHRSKK